MKESSKSSNILHTLQPHIEVVQRQGLMSIDLKLSKWQLSETRFVKNHAVAGADAIIR